MHRRMSGLWPLTALVVLSTCVVHAAERPILKDNAREYLALRQTLCATTLTPAQAAGARSAWRGKTVEVLGRVLGRTNTTVTNSANPISVMLAAPGCADLCLVDALEDNPLLTVDQVVHILADLPEVARPTDHFVLRAVISEDDLPAVEQRYAAAEADVLRVSELNHATRVVTPSAPSAEKSVKPVTIATPPVEPVAPAPPANVSRPGTDAPQAAPGPQLNASAGKAVSAWKQWVSKINPKLTDNQLAVIVRSVLYYSALFGIDHRLSFAMIECESDYDPKCLSHSGAMGLCQLMPFNAKDYGVDPWDLEQNIKGGLNELSEHLKSYSSKSNYEQCILGLACYNAGPGAVKRAGHQVPNITETQHYVKRVGDLFYQLWKSGMP